MSNSILDVHIHNYEYNNSLFKFNNLQKKN